MSKSNTKITTSSDTTAHTSTAVDSTDKTELLRSLLTATPADDVHALLSELGFVVDKAIVAKAASKQSLANAALDIEYAKAIIPQRKDLIAMLIDTCGMGKAYASTALQIYRENRGLVNHKA
jgi:hypothetical protein